MLKFHIIESGYFLGDGGVMFGPVPKKYWSNKYKTDENNMCEMSLRCLFIETDNRRILVDTGLGDKHNPKLKFYQPYNQKNIVEEIRKIGYAPEEVTDVILTHLHFDHCGASTVLDEKNRAVPTFPNATYRPSCAGIAMVSVYFLPVKFVGFVGGVFVVRKAIQFITFFHNIIYIFSTKSTERMNLFHFSIPKKVLSRS